MYLRTTKHHARKERRTAKCARTGFLCSLLKHVVKTNDSSLIDCPPPMRHNDNNDGHRRNPAAFLLRNCRHTTSHAIGLRAKRPQASPQEKAAPCQGPLKLQPPGLRAAATKACP